MTNHADVGALEELDVEECWALVRAKVIGRLASNRHGMGPHVVPVNYEVDSDRSIVFRSAEGTKLDAVARGDLTFQVDEVDPLHHSGWSVMIEGPAHWMIVEPGDPGVEPWGPGDHPYIVRLRPTRVTGRRIRLAQPDTDGRGYR